MQLGRTVTQHAFNARKSQCNVKSHTQLPTPGTLWVCGATTDKPAGSLKTVDDVRHDSQGTSHVVVESASSSHQQHHGAAAPSRHADTIGGGFLASVLSSLEEESAAGSHDLLSGLGAGSSSSTQHAGAGSTSGDVAPSSSAGAGPEAGSAPGLSAWLAPLGAAGGVLLMVGGGFLFQDQIRGFINFFIAAVDDWGPWGYVAFAAVYAGLEVLAVPAIPLTMTAGAIFGVVPGTLLVSVAATVAATIAFLIARYAVRDKVAKFAERNPNWVAIDRAIGRDGFKFVTLLRLSPLLPLSLSNYLYGLTSVDLGSYVLGSWLGMLPGTYAYISAGHVGKAVLTQGEGSLGVEGWQVAVGLGVTVVAIGFVGRLAKNAIDEIKEEQKAEAAAAVLKGEVTDVSDVK